MRGSLPKRQRRVKAHHTFNPMKYVRMPGVLPRDMVIAVLRWLQAPADLARMALVCRAWRYAARSDTLWQSMFERVAKLLDCPREEYTVIRPWFAAYRAQFCYFDRESRVGFASLAYTRRVLLAAVRVINKHSVVGYGNHSNYEIVIQHKLDNDEITLVLYADETELGFSKLRIWTDDGPARYPPVAEYGTAYRYLVRFGHKMQLHAIPGNYRRFMDFHTKFTDILAFFTVGR